MTGECLLDYLDLMSELLIVDPRSTAGDERHGRLQQCGSNGARSRGIANAHVSGCDQVNAWSSRASQTSIPTWIASSICARVIAGSSTILAVPKATLRESKSG